MGTRLRSVNILPALAGLFHSPAWLDEIEVRGVETRGPGQRHHKSAGTIRRQVMARRAKCC